MAVADKVPDYVEVRPIEKDRFARVKECGMRVEAPLLPLALQKDELTEGEFEALYRSATDPNATKGRLKRALRAIPMREHDPATV